MKVTVAWGYNAADVTNYGVTSFRVERKSEAVAGPGAFAYLGTAQAAQRSFDDTTVSPNTTYSYRVIAVSSSGNSDPSSPAQILTQGLPPAPASTTLTQTV